jgi:uncharacterized iron-regulated protein
MQLRLKLLSLTIAISLLTACQGPINSAPLLNTVKSSTQTRTLITKPLQHSYDYRLLKPAGQPIELDQLVKELKDSDIIVIGEFHGNHGSHLLQMQLQAALHKQRPEQILSLEMFNKDQQSILNRYLDGEVGEKYLINEAPAWPNYSASYRPMIEFSKHHLIPVVAANAAADIVRCIGRYGQGYVDILNPEEKGWIARSPFQDDENYRQKFYSFMESMQHGQMDDAKILASYSAQLARDNTMAEAIIEAIDQHQNAQVIHLNGSFHSESGLGTIALIKQRRPNLKISVITPINRELGQTLKLDNEESDLGNYLYFTVAQPIEFIDANYKRKARMNMFKNASKKANQCRNPGKIQ